MLEISELPLDRFVNYPSSFEVDRGISNALCSESKDKEEDIERTLSVIIDKCKHIYADKRNKAIGKKSISFLMKKIFVCRSRNCPTPSLRDTLQESRMEKDNASQENLHKKIFSVTVGEEVHKGQEDDKEEDSPIFLNTFPKHKKPYFQQRNEDESDDKNGDGCKWVKTDSECKLHFDKCHILMKTMVEIKP
ncbi:hypothetical protein HKD37_09G025463 [Glycine soja]